jgi:flagellar biosynthesis/type III secretory pathway M-ring protein FliF/YscJ
MPERETPPSAEGAPVMEIEKIKVSADPRRGELMKIAREHKELVVQVIRGWLKEEKQRLRAEANAR